MTGRGSRGAVVLVTCAFVAVATFVAPGGAADGGMARPDKRFLGVLPSRPHMTAAAKPGVWRVFFDSMKFSCL